MTSLGFDLLDLHVVRGRGDDIAWSDDTGTHTFAQLLERAAALAGGLRAVGVSPGDEVTVEVTTGRLQVEVVLACIRLGAVPGDRGDVRVVEDGSDVTVHGEEEYDLSLVVSAGRTDPAAALPADPPEYRALVLEKWPMLNAFAE